MKDFPKKWASKLPSEYESKVTALEKEEIEEEILDAEDKITQTENIMEDDEKLKVLKSDLKDLVGGYRDVMKEQQAKIKFCMFTLHSRGIR